MNESGECEVEWVYGQSQDEILPKSSFCYFVGTDFPRFPIYADGTPDSSYFVFVYHGYDRATTASVETCSIIHGWRGLALWLACPRQNLT